MLDCYQYLIEEIQAYKKAIRIKPSFIRAYYNLGLSYLLLAIRALIWKDRKS
jgi:tetratricopeptide (TPR) repeat protein